MAASTWTSSDNRTTMWRRFVENIYNLIPMAASNWTSSDNETTLMQKAVDNLAAYGASIGKTGTQTSSSDDNRTDLLKKVVNNTYKLN